MASAQEFSSPGDHMASSGGSSGVTSTATIWGPGTRVGPGWSDSGSSVGSNSFDNGSDSSNVNVREPVDPKNYFDYSYINKMFESLLEKYGGFGSNAQAYSDYMEDMFDKYTAYNDEMFNRAKEYDEYMSNTAIQRQVEDLKKAGLNPILASHLGGASFTGVNPPYVSINPASGFSGLASLEGTKYSADASIEVAKLHTASSEFIAQFNKAQEAILQDDEQAFRAVAIDLQRAADEYLETLKYNHQFDLQDFGFRNSKDLEKYKNDLNKEFNDWYYSNDSEYMKNYVKWQRWWNLAYAAAPGASSALSEKLVNWIPDPSPFKNPIGFHS